jgi:hypothetical protein
MLKIEIRDLLGKTPVGELCLRRAREKLKIEANFDCFQGTSRFSIERNRILQRGSHYTIRGHDVSAG